MTKVRILKGIFQGDILEIRGYSYSAFSEIHDERRSTDRIVIVRTPNEYIRRDYFNYLFKNVEFISDDIKTIKTKEVKIKEPKYPFYIVADEEGFDAERFNNLDKALEVAQKDITTMGGDSNDNELYILVPIYKITQSVSAKITKL